MCLIKIPVWTLIAIDKTINYLSINSLFIIYLDIF
jgi:hypothetical protein